ncbi:zinc finger HIT domain-containing protein 3 isoform X2 [Palaemon carinicauda]|uniref:zinc finger HIT domain-containing protein 3 isoform X2 n=1 Tax=Palaemon carinicauda TaxID=392227 RepID=UPI0035B675BA
METSCENSCQVCSHAAFKYKCPSCSVKYCSVPCYKIHKAVPCQPKKSEANVTLEIDGQGNILSRQVLFPTDDTVMPATLEKLRASEKLKELFKNQHLREMIKEVDSHPNPKLMMHRAMKEPIFTEFTDVCLHIVEPPEEVDETPKLDIDT